MQKFILISFVILGILTGCGTQTPLEGGFQTDVQLQKGSNSTGLIARHDGDDVVLENGLVAVTISAAEGSVQSWIIKETGRELAFIDNDYKALLAQRLWVPSESLWDGGWPTEAGRATWNTRITKNTITLAIVRQSLTLREDSFAQGLRIVKEYTMRQNTYGVLIKYSFVNPTGHEISFEGEAFSMTLESTAIVGPGGGRLGWSENGNVTITNEGAIVEANFDWIGLETNGGDAVFVTTFLDLRPHFGWLNEFQGDDGRDMEPHFDLGTLQPNEGKSIRMMVFGGPGNLEQVR